MTRKNEQFSIRKTSKMKQMVEDLMTKKGFISYSELFRALIREAWEKLDV